MPSASSGDTTSNSIGRVLCSESTSNAAVRDSPNATHRSHSGRKASVALISMNVANASFSQMPFHHFIVTRSPNHMCASSWWMTSATFMQLGLRRPFRVDEQQHLAERDAAEVLHRAEREVGDRDQVALVARVGDRVVAGQPLERERRALEREGRQMTLARRVDDAQRRATDRRPAQSPRADRPRTRRCTSTSSSCRRT